MTPDEWLRCPDPAWMLDALRGKATDRKLRLFTAACGRCVWPWVGDPRSRRAVEAGELYADGRIAHTDLETAAAEAKAALYAISRPVRKSRRPERLSLKVRWAAAVTRLPTWTFEVEWGPRPQTIPLRSLSTLCVRLAVYRPPRCQASYGTSSATLSARSPSVPAGGPPMCWGWPVASTRKERSTGCRSWPTP
jgi:hypothetical protein